MGARCQSQARPLSLATICGVTHMTNESGLVYTPHRRAYLKTTSHIAANAQPYFWLPIIAFHSHDACIQYARAKPVFNVSEISAILSYNLSPKIQYKLVWTVKRAVTSIWLANNYPFAVAFIKTMSQ